MSAFGCHCPHTTVQHEPQPDGSMACSACSCRITHEGVRAFLHPSQEGLTTRQVRALESIAASLEKLANPPETCEPPRLPDDRSDPRLSPGWRDPHDAGRDR